MPKASTAKKLAAKATKTIAKPLEEKLGKKLGELAKPKQYEEEHAKYVEQRGSFITNWKDYLDKDDVKASLQKEMTAAVHNLSDDAKYQAIKFTREAQMEKTKKLLAEQGIKEPSNQKLTCWTKAIRQLAGKDFCPQPYVPDEDGETNRWMTPKSYKSFYNLLSVLAKNENLARRTKQCVETNRREGHVDMETNQQLYEELMNKVHEAEAEMKEPDYDKDLIISNLQRANHGFVMRNRDLKARVGKQERHLKELEDHRDKLSAEKQQLQADVDHLKNRLGDSRKLVAKFSEEKQQLQATVDKQKAGMETQLFIKELVKDNEELRTENKELRTTVDKQKAGMKETQEFINILAEENDELKNPSDQKRHYLDI